MENLFETRPDFTCNHDMRRCTVNGKDMFCTDERIKDEDMPKDLYKAEVRSSDHEPKWATIEPKVCVNHIATLVSDQPFNFDKEMHLSNGKVDPYIEVKSYEIEHDPDLDEPESDYPDEFNRAMVEEEAERLLNED